MMKEIKGNEVEYIQILQKKIKQLQLRLDNAVQIYKNQRQRLIELDERIENLELEIIDINCTMEKNR